MKDFKNTLKVAFFVIGNIVGAGFFLMPSSVAFLGRNLIWSWVIGACIALIFALIFGRLYLIYPKSSDLSEYFGDFHLKQTVAFLYWIGIIIGNVIVLTMIVSVVKLPSYFDNLLLVGVLVLLLSFGNYFFNALNVTLIETILSCLKFFILILVPIIVFLSDPRKVILPPANGSINDILQIGVLSFWSFMGIETAGVFGSGKEAKNGLLIGITACFLLYVFSCFFIVGSVPVSLLQNGNEIPIVYLIRFSKFKYFAKYVGYLIVFTSFTSLYGWFATSSIIALSFAKSKVFPSFFLKETKSEGSFWGLWGAAALTFLVFCLVSALNASKQFELIADFCVNISLIIFGLCANVLYMQSKNFFDIFLSLFGMILVIILLSMNLLFSCCCVSLFVIYYYLSKFFF